MEIGVLLILLACVGQAQNDILPGNEFEDVATTLGLSPLPASWTVPIEVNVFTIGFDGSGNLAVNIPDERLQQWLEHLDFMIPERVIGPFADRFSSENNDVKHTNYKEFPSIIQYKYHYHLVKLCRDVTSVIEMALERNFRDDGEEIQINPRIVSNLLEDLVSYLRLTSSAFNIFVLNPRKHWAGGLRYGYRDGLSEEELKQIHNSPQLFDLLRSLISLNQTKPVPAPREKAEVKRLAAVSRSEMSSLSTKWALRQIQQLQRQPPGPLTVDAFLGSLITATKQLKQHTQLLDLNVTAENCLLDTWVSSGSSASSRLAFVDLAAGPFEWGPVVGGEGFRTKDSLPNITTFVVNFTEPTSEVEGGEIEAKYDWEVIEAEKAMVEEYLAAECDREADKSPECEGMRKKLQQIVAFMQRAQPVDKVSEHDFEHANAFSFFTHESGQNAHSDSLIQHQFLGHLNSMLSSSLRHLVTPTLSPPLNLQTTYSPRVIFHIYILRNHNRDVGLNTLISQLERALLAVKLTGQVFTFAVRTLNMDDDPRLALAFTTSLRSAVIPSINAAGMFDAEQRMYLDSKSLEFELTRIDDEEDARPSNDHHAKGTREVPIFIFSLDTSDVPILIDKYYQSRVVGNLVVATQSTTNHFFKSDLMCNTNPILWDLKNPIKSILQSTLQALAGIIPTHVQAGGVLQRITNDWKWSVGAHACALTSNGVEISRLQVDIAHRAHITSAIRFAHTSIQDSLARLSSIRLPKGHAEKLWEIAQIHSSIHLAEFHEAGTVLGLYEIIQKNITALAECASNGDEKCFDLIPQFVVSVKLLVNLLNDVHEGAFLSQCDPPQPVSWIGVAGYMFLGSLCLLTCLRVIFAGPGKPKINQD